MLSEPSPPPPLTPGIASSKSHSIDFPATDQATMGSTMELKMEDLKEPLDEIARVEQRKEEIASIKRSWREKQMPDPRKWPRLKLVQNYDEDPGAQRAASRLKGEIRKWRRRKLGFDDEMDEEKEAWELIEEYGSDDNRFEASELVEYRNHEWCVALRICREQADDRRVFQLLVYSYQCGIQRLQLDTNQIEFLGDTLLMRYKVNFNRTIEVLPVYSALPSTGLLSLKYRTNKGIELRVYGIVNFIDFDKDADQMLHKTMIWTDALGPVYLSMGERANIRRKLQMTEPKLFAPLRMCQITVKGEFTSNVGNGTFLKWSVASYTPLIEEAPKDPNIGRNFWPARVLRFDDLIRDVKKTPNGSFSQPPSNIGTWLRSVSQPEIRVFAGTQLKGILESGGPKYTEKGVMMGFVVPCFHQHKFIYYEALIVGPPRVVMLITEGRFSNYNPKSFPPSIQNLQDSCKKEKETMLRIESERIEKKIELKEPKKHPQNHMKSLRGFEEFHFDF